VNYELREKLSTANIALHLMLTRPVTRAGEAPLQTFSPALEKRVGLNLKLFYIV